MVFRWNIDWQGLLNCNVWFAESIPIISNYISTGFIMFRGELSPCFMLKAVKSHFHLVNSLRHPQCLIKQKHMLPLFPSFLMVKSQHRRLCFPWDFAQARELWIVWCSTGRRRRRRTWRSCGPSWRKRHRATLWIDKASCSMLQQLGSRLVTVKHYNSYQWYCKNI